MTTKPPKELARIFRFVEPGTLPSTKLLCIYDETKNLLVIDKEKFAKLDDMQQRTVLRTHASSIELDYTLGDNDVAIAA